MIFTAKGPEPKTLRNNAGKWKSQLETALATGEKSKIDTASEKYNNANIKTQLEIDFHSKCAYCESKIKHVSYTNIEHFKPKSLFRDLTFSWENLLLSCTICNDPAHKGIKFPSDEEGGPFVNPCEEDPSDHFDFHYDPIGNIASVVPITERGETTERILGLNRDDLRTQRTRTVKNLAFIARKASEGDQEAIDLLELAKGPDYEYAAFARSLGGLIVKTSRPAK